MTKRRVFISFFPVLLSVVLAWPPLGRAAAPPAPPTSVIASVEPNVVRVIVNWEKSPTEGVTYRVYRSTNAASAGTLLAENLVIFSYIDTAVSPQASYYYRVAAVLDGVESERLAAPAVTPTIFAPTNVRAVDTTRGREIKLAWERPTLSVILYYNVYRSTSASGYFSEIASKVIGTEYYDSGVTDGTTYFYRLRSMDAANNQSGDSQVVTATPSDEGAPRPPTNVRAAAAANGAVSVSWSAPTGGTVTAYEVYRSTSTGETGDVRTRTGGTSYTEYALPAGVTFYYRVKSVNRSNKLSEPSDPARATVPATTSGPVRSQIKVTGLTAEGTLKRGEILLRWRSPGSAAAYARVYRRTRTDETPVAIVDRLSGQEYLDRTAEPGKDYYYTVRLVAADGYEYEASEEVRGVSFTEPSRGGTTDKNQKTALSSGAKASPAALASYAYGKPRLKDLRLEAALANNLRKFLVAKLGERRVPRILHPVLVRAYLYGGYAVDEIAHTVTNGPGLVHPTIRAVEWRRSAEYRKNK